MNALYLAGLCFGIAGMLVLDARFRLFFFRGPVRAAIVLVVGVAAFLLWDSAGIGLGIFFEGDHALLLGVDLAPQLPLEEPVFLVLLCYSAMNAFGFATRVLSPPERARG
jgi:lycopene cyclase domain-containing protein